MQIICTFPLTTITYHLRLKHMKLQICGAAQTVTGSCHLITLENNFKILLDCGLYQGHEDELEDFNSQWYFKPSELDVLILSHAHIDHCGTGKRWFSRENILYFRHT